jgi:hypothetical protein
VSAVRRRYRIRFAERGAVEITDGTTEYTLLVADTHSIPVVAGSIAHPIQGATEMRPVTLVAVDRDGVQTLRFAQEKATTFAWLNLCPQVQGRWDMVGRLVDLAWQLSEDDPESDEWTTYGTGRCSGFRQGSGPGLYQVEISDESWRVRKEKRVFKNADTTQLWPASVRNGIESSERFALFRPWRGIPKANPAVGRVIDNVGNMYRIELFAITWLRHPAWPEGPEAFPWQRGGAITDGLLRWIRADRKEQVDFDPDPFPEGNFKHLRLRWGKGHVFTGLPDLFFEIVSFGGLTEEEMWTELESPHYEYFLDGQTVHTRIRLWVRAFELTVQGEPEPHPPTSFEPITNQAGTLLAPTAPPSKDLPLHIGVNNPAHEWGTDGGYIHVADLTRRMWNKLEIRYDADNLDAIEADLSFPALAPWVAEGANDPEKWLEGVLSNCGLISLRDQRGRRKLVDIRPVQEVDFDGLPRIDATNSRGHTWSVVGRETINLIDVQYADIRPAFGGFSSGGIGDEPFVEEPDNVPHLDGLRVVNPEMPPFEGDTLIDAGERPYEFEALYTLEPSATSERKVDLMQQGRGALWEDIADDMMMGWLESYQDGLQRYRGEVGKTLADTLEEGDLILLDHESLQVPNQRTRDTTGESVLRLISVTRYPAHADIEAIWVPARPFEIFEEPCP